MNVVYSFEGLICMLVVYLLIFTWCKWLSCKCRESGAFTEEEELQQTSSPPATSDSRTDGSFDNLDEVWCSAPPAYENCV